MAVPLEIRKLQRLGSSSYIVTLPVNWVRKHGLKAGDPITILEEDGSLRIKPTEFSAPSNEFRIELGNRDNSIDEKTLKHLLLVYHKIIISYRDISAVNRLIDKLREEIPLKVKANGGQIEIIKEEDPLDLGENIKEIGRMVVSLIETIIQGDRTIPSSLIERMLDIKFYGIKGKILKQSNATETEDLFLINIAEIYSIIEQLRLLSLKMIDIVKVLSNHGKDDDFSQISELLKRYADAFWELVAGIANNSLKRVRYSGELLRDVLSDVNEKVTSEAYRALLTIILQEALILASKVEDFLTRQSLFEKNALANAAKPLAKEIVV